MAVRLPLRRSSIVVALGLGTGALFGAGLWLPGLGLSLLVGALVLGEHSSWLGRRTGRLDFLRLPRI